MLGGDYLGSKDIKLEIAGGIMYTSENEDQITSNRRHQKELVVVSISSIDSLLSFVVHTMEIVSCIFNNLYCSLFL